MQLAQLNLAHMLGPIDSEIMRPFVELLDEVNALAEASPGFIWRDTAAEGDPGWKIDGEPMLILNLSVWQSPVALQAFVYQGLHRTVLNRRREWFELPKVSHYVMWWVEDGQMPSREEAYARLEYLRQNGESDHAFTYRSLKNS